VEIRAMQWAAVETYLKPVDSPLDIDVAIQMFPDGVTRVRAAVKPRVTEPPSPDDVVCAAAVAVSSPGQRPAECSTKCDPPIHRTK
jgi:hypothetical protein